MGIIDDAMSRTNLVRFQELGQKLMDDFRRSMTSAPEAEASLKLDLWVVQEFLSDMVLRSHVAVVDDIEQRLQVFEGLLEEQLSWTKRGNSIRTGPLFTYTGAQALETAEAQFKGGNPQALLTAVATCARHGLKIPGWAADPFCHAVDEVRTFRVRSWDQAFGNPLPKGKRLSALRRNAEVADRIVLHVVRAKDTGSPVDRALFEEVAEKFHIARTTAEDLYYGRRKQLSAAFAARVLPPV